MAKIQSLQSVAMAKFQPSQKVAMAEVQSSPSIAMAEVLSSQSVAMCNAHRVPIRYESGGSNQIPQVKFHWWVCLASSPGIFAQN